MFPFANPRSTPAAAPVGTTWNAADKIAAIALSNNDRTAQQTGGQQGMVRATSYRSSGQVYAELTWNDSAPNGSSAGGIASMSQSINERLGAGSNSTGYKSDGTVAAGGKTETAGKASIPTGSILGIALDADARTCKWYVDGQLQHTSTSIATGPLTLAFDVNTQASTNTCTINTGGQPFVYPLPSGFVAWG